MQHGSFHFVRVVTSNPNGSSTHWGLGASGPKLSSEWFSVANGLMFGFLDPEDKALNQYPKPQIMIPAIIADMAPSHLACLSFAMGASDSSLGLRV